MAEQPRDDEPADTDAERLAIRKRAMDMLARREHARAELEAKLAKREHRPEDIAVALDALAEDGLQSDARYAQAMVASRAARGVGPVRVRAELASVNVDAGEIDHALAHADVDWCALAESARVKRFGPELPGDFPTKAKQMRFLQRRGFDGAMLKAVFDD